MKKIKNLVSTLEQDMFDLLKRLVLIQSGTHNKGGVDEMAQVLRDVLEDIPMQAEIIPMKECGDMVLARNTLALKQKSILLAGHMDTVFPKDTSFNFYREDEERAFGPGVMDMKGGLVVGVTALKVLSLLGVLDKIPITVFFNSEEEIGSPYSRKNIEELAAQSMEAYVLEGGGLGSEVVVGRKGKIGFDLLIAGRAGHAGCAGVDKPSAVLEAAHKIIALEGLNKPPDILVNAGLVQGGMGPNSIAEKASLGVDVRFVNPEDEELILEKIRSITEKCITPGTRAELVMKSSRPPMKTNSKIEEIYHKAFKAAEAAGVPIGKEVRGGVSDANFITALGIPVLDGMGPCGDLDHSDQEYIIKKSMGQRVELLAHCLFENRL
ncbi:MAG: M20 family peptidase [Desulfonatronovibrio sp. MSAO_Bac4]|nr:MAG: M20 family peptidase [Desulfonatronovibrio sp. MSAO_Bac4]